MSEKNEGPKKHSAWVTLSSREVYSNPWIKVKHNEVTTPSGTPGVYGVVSFKNHAVGVIPVDHDGNTWLVCQTRYVLGMKTWEIPEGGVPNGEALVLGAKRELQEEVGLKASHYETLMEMDLSNSVTDEKATVFVATGLEACEPNHEDTEDITVRKLPIKEAIQMVIDGQITDAISVAALLKYSLRLS